MEKRILGAGLEVSAIGLGCMSMTGGYSDQPERAEMLDLIRTGVDPGVTSSTPPKSTDRTSTRNSLAKRSRRSGPGGDRD